MKKIKIQYTNKTKNKIFIFSLQHTKQNLQSAEVPETFRSCGGGELFLVGIIIWQY